MPGPHSRPVPKPVKGQYRKKRQAAQIRLSRGFRDLVWEDSAPNFWHPTEEYGKCGECHRLVCRSKGEGHVHHLRGRNVAPEDLYNPDEAVLLCTSCHRKAHH